MCGVCFQVFNGRKTKHYHQNLCAKSSPKYQPKVVLPRLPDQIIEKALKSIATNDQIAATNKKDSVSSVSASNKGGANGDCHGEVLQLGTKATKANESSQATNNSTGDQEDKDPELAFASFSKLPKGEDKDSGVDNGEGNDSDDISVFLDTQSSLPTRGRKRKRPDPKRKGHRFSACRSPVSPGKRLSEHENEKDSTSSSGTPSPTPDKKQDIDSDDNEQRSTSHSFSPNTPTKRGRHPFRSVAAVASTATGKDAVPHVLNESTLPTAERKCPTNSTILKQDKPKLKGSNTCISPPNTPKSTKVSIRESQERFVATTKVRNHPLVVKDLRLRKPLSAQTVKNSAGP